MVTHSQMSYQSSKMSVPPDVTPNLYTSVQQGWLYKTISTVNVHNAVKV